MFKKRSQVKKQAETVTNNAAEAAADLSDNSVRLVEQGARTVGSAASEAAAGAAEAGTSASAAAVPRSAPPPRMPQGQQGQGQQPQGRQTQGAPTSAAASAVSGSPSRPDPLPRQPMPPSMPPAMPGSTPPRANAPTAGTAPRPPRPPQQPAPSAAPQRGPDPITPPAALTGGIATAPQQGRSPTLAPPAAPQTLSASEAQAPAADQTNSSFNSGYASMSSSASDSGKLIVGSDIELSGQVKNCDLLVVEGVVEATLINTKALEVTEQGVFRGTAPVQKAYIAGLVEGDLVVDGHVMIRSTGVVNGNVKFDEIEIERGGRIRGSMQQIDDADSSGSDDVAGD